MEESLAALLGEDGDNDDIEEQESQGYVPVQIKGGGLNLDLGDYIKKVTNPELVSGSKEFEIQIKPIPGFKPLTQCMGLESLWNISVKFDTNKKDLLEKTKNATAGPVMVKISTFSIACWLKNLKFEQQAGNKEYYYHWTMNFIEKNDYPGESPSSLEINKLQQFPWG